MEALEVNYKALRGAPQRVDQPSQRRPGTHHPASPSAGGGSGSREHPPPAQPPWQWLRPPGPPRPARPLTGYASHITVAKSSGERLEERAGLGVGLWGLAEGSREPRHTEATLTETCPRPVPVTSQRLQPPPAPPDFRPPPANRRRPRPPEARPLAVTRPAREGLSWGRGWLLLAPGISVQVNMCESV